MDVTALVLDDGDRVTAWGRLIQDHAGTWFEPPLPKTLIMIQDPPVAAHWPGAVPVSGAAMQNVEDFRQRKGLTEGWATLSGIWSASQLQVDRQDPVRDAEVDLSEEFPDWRVPPGVPPDGGWPRWPDDEHRLEYNIGDLTDTGAAVGVTVFRPGRRQDVLVVAASDPDAVDAWLRPQLGARLCVVPTRWTRSELRTVREQISARWDDWHVYGAGEINASDGQPFVTVNLARILPEVAVWATPLQDGIVTLRPWIAPVRA